MDDEDNYEATAWLWAWKAFETRDMDPDQHSEQFDALERYLSDQPDIWFGYGDEEQQRVEWLVERFFAPVEVPAIFAHRETRPENEKAVRRLTDLIAANRHKTY